MAQDLLRKAFHRLHNYQGLLIIVFSFYYFIPDHYFAKNVIKQIAIGHLTGAFALALTVYILFFLIFPLLLMYTTGRQISLDTNHPLMKKFLSINFYLSTLSAIFIMIYLAYSDSKNDWTFWPINFIAIIEILVFAKRGDSTDKKLFFFHHFKSSAVLYGAVIFVGLNEVDNLSFSKERYYIPIAIFHLLGEIFFMPIERRDIESQ